MLQQEQPDDYVVAMDETHSVREFAELAFGLAGLDCRDHVVVDPQFYWPAEVEILLGNAAKAKAELGWSPSIDFKSLSSRDGGIGLQRGGNRIAFTGKMTI